MSNAIHTETVGNFTIAIYHDDIPLNPRKDFDPMGKIIMLDQRNYNVGDEKHNCYDINELYDDIMEDYNPTVIIPVYFYDHGSNGCSIREVGSIDDATGFTFVSRENLLNEYSVKIATKKAKEKATKVLLGELETYSQYLNGDVFYYSITDLQGEIVDSCGGFFGDYDGYILEEAKRQAEYFENERIKNLHRCEMLNQLGKM